MPHVRSATEIAEGWFKVYPAKNDIAKKERIEAIEADPEQVERFRSYLTNLSWLMKSIVKPIARKANADDEVTGRFWVVGKTPYSHFEGPPSQNVLRKIEEYGTRYKLTPVIDVSPL
jgi:hypothetical protein